MPPVGMTRGVDIDAPRRSRRSMSVINVRFLQKFSAGLDPAVIGRIMQQHHTSGALVASPPSPEASLWKRLGYKSGSPGAGAATGATLAEATKKSSDMNDVLVHVSADPDVPPMTYAEMNKMAASRAKDEKRQASADGAEPSVKF